MNTGIMNLKNTFPKIIDTIELFKGLDRDFKDLCDDFEILSEKIYYLENNESSNIDKLKTKILKYKKLKTELMNEIKPCVIMKTNIIYLTVLIAVVISCTNPPKETADTIYTNVKIYTVNDAQPWAESVAIKDGKFIKVGSTVEVESLAGENTKIIDLEGQFMMPGLHDTHVHFEGFYNAKMLEGKTLRYSGEETSIEELREKLKKYAENNPDLDVLFVEQLAATFFPGLSPTKAFIDEIVPNKPVIMLTDSEHEALLNTKALEMEGITSETPIPFGGEIVKDPQTGEPTGFLKESAAGKWGWKYFPDLTREQHYEGMKGVVKYLNSLGITSAKEQHAKNHWAQGFKDMETNRELTMRIGLSWTYKGPLEPSPVEDQEKTIENRNQFASNLIGTEYVKLSIDGTLGTTGLVVEPYIQTNDYGIKFYELNDLINDVSRFDAMGFGITAHCNADGAVRQFLDALSEAKKRNGKLNGRHQIAHAVLIHQDDLPRIAELNVTVEFSPVFWFPTTLAEGLAPQIGAERMKHTFPMKSVQNNGGRFVLASDGPLMWQVPLQAMESAISRKAPNGDKKMQSPLEKIDLPTAIKAYTINSAYLMNQDDITGSIEKGKFADFIILDKNLLEIPADDISETKILKTIFNGKEVYSVENNK